MFCIGTSMIQTSVTKICFESQRKSFMYFYAVLGLIYTDYVIELIIGLVFLNVTYTCGLAIQSSILFLSYT